MTVVEHEIHPCFNKPLGAVPRNLICQREREIGWTCSVGTVMNIQQVIVSNESDTLNQAKKALCVFYTISSTFIDNARTSVSSALYVK